MLAARSYSAIIGPLLACLTPDIIPEVSRRKLLIFCLEYVELFFSIARSPTSQYGGIDGVSRELTRIAGVLSDAVRTAFAGQMFKNKRGGRLSRAAGGGGGGGGAASGASGEAGGANDDDGETPVDDGDLDFYKLHMMLPSHLAHFLQLFGPLWDTACGTAEACGRHLKRLFLSTNRHDRSVSAQLVDRFNESFFINSILPRLKAAAAKAGALLGAATGAAAASSRLQSKHALHSALLRPPVDSTELTAAWNVLRPELQLDVFTNYSCTWFSECKLTRNTEFKRVCDGNVSSASVVLQYCPRAPGAAAAGPRLLHDHTLQPVKTALLLRPIAFFTAARKGGAGGGAGALGGAARLDFCVARRYQPLLEETPRSLEYTLYKPRTLDRSCLVVIPVSELSHPLRVR